MVQDIKIRIDVYANLLSQSIYEKVSPAPAIAGGQTYRTQGEFTSSSGWREGSTFVFFGKNWKMTSSGGTYLTFTPDKSIQSSTVVQNIVVKVQADPKRAERIIQLIDREALKKLIK